MKNDDEEKTLTPEDILQEYKFVQKEWHDAEKKFYAENEKKRIWMCNCVR
jgi:hypothetical protein